VANDAKLQRPWRAQEAAVPAQESAALGGMSRCDGEGAARRWRTAVSSWATGGAALLGEGVWKGHAV